MSQDQHNIFFEVLTIVRNIVLIIGLGAALFASMLIV